MPWKTIIFSLIICLIAISFTDHSPAAQTQQKATFKELTATTSETHLLLFGTLQYTFSSEMVETLHSGIPLRFSFFVELNKIAENWPEEQVITRNFQHVLTYDTLKETYRITLEEDNNRIVSFKSLEEGQKVLNEINGARIVELSQLIPDNRYKLKIRAELYQKTLPLSLHNVLPFLSWWDIETDWHSLEFKF